MKKMKTKTIIKVIDVLNIMIMIIIVIKVKTIKIETMKKESNNRDKNSGRNRENKDDKYDLYNSEREGITIKPPFVNLTLNLPPLTHFKEILQTHFKKIVLE